MIGQRFFINWIRQPFYNWEKNGNVEYLLEIRFLDGYGNQPEKTTCQLAAIAAGSPRKGGALHRRQLRSTKEDTLPRCV
jgi:hypothetical protein